MKKIISFFSAAFILFCFCCNLVSVSADDIESYSSDYSIFYSSDCPSIDKVRINNILSAFSSNNTIKLNDLVIAGINGHYIISSLSLMQNYSASHSGYIGYISSGESPYIHIYFDSDSLHFSFWDWGCMAYLPSTISGDYNLHSIDYFKSLDFSGLYNKLPYNNSRVFNFEYLDLSFDSLYTAPVYGTEDTYSGFDPFSVFYLSDWNKETPSLTFSFSHDFHNNMSLDNYGSSFQIDVKNTTDHIYNYVVFVSDRPASNNIQASFQNSLYMMSSKQWCYLYVNQTSKPDNLGTNIFETLYNIYGGDIIDRNGKLYDLYDLYISLNSTHCEYYLLCNTVCPFYKIFGTDQDRFSLWAGQTVTERSHVINFQDLGLEVNKQYYLNIAYIDMTDFKLYGSSEVATPNIAYPIFRDDFLNSYSLYSVTPFSFSDGIFQKNDSDLYGYSDYYHYLNPGSASGYISSSDNSVSTNNSNNTSDDHSIQTIYNNYGTIYHGNSNFLNGSSGSSSGSGSSPDLPDADFKDLTDKTGNFFDFIKSIWIASGWLPGVLFATAVTVAIFCRVAGR